MGRHEDGGGGVERRRTALCRLALGIESALPFEPFRAPGDFDCTELAGSGFIVVEGDARVEGGFFEGFLVVLGDLHLSGGVFEGAVFVAGEIRIAGAARISGTLYALGGFAPDSSASLLLEGRLWTRQPEPWPVRHAPGSERFGLAWPRGLEEIGRALAAV